MDQHSQNSPSPMATQFGAIPSPPPGSVVRRHQSPTYGTARAGVSLRRMASPGLRRAGTLQNQGRSHGHQSRTLSPTGGEEDFTGSSHSHEDESYFDLQANQGQQYLPTTPINRSQWSIPSNEWHPFGGNANLVGPNSGSSAIDDVQRAMSSMDTNSQGQGYSAAAFSGAQSNHPPPFNPNQAQQFTALRNITPTDGDGSASRRLHLVTNMDERGNQVSGGSSGPVSASAYVPPIGHGLPQSTGRQERGATGETDDRAFTASGTWDQKERTLHTRSSNPNINYGTNAQQQPKAQGIPSVPPILAQPLQATHQQNPRLGLNTQLSGVGALGAQPGLLTSPIDIPTLIATKGYNPQNFDTRPAFVRCLCALSFATFIDWSFRLAIL